MENKLSAKTLLNSVDIGIVIIDSNGEIEELNSYLSNIATKNGCTKLTGNYFDFLKNALNITLKNSEELKSKIEKIFNGSASNFEITLESNLKEPIGSWLIKARTDEPQPIKRLVVTHGNISRLKHLEAELRKITKMETASLLTGGVAAEFNNCLQVIVGKAELLTEELPFRDPTFFMAADICAASMKAAQLNRKLLALSKIQVLRPVPINLNSFLESLKDKIQKIVPANVNCDFDLAEDLDYVFADLPQMEQSILNIVQNSIEAMPDGGKLTFKTTNNRNDSRKCSCKELEDDSRDWCMLEIHDTGKGMDIVTASRSFEPFFTTKEVGDGLGLGLSYVYGVALQSGGHICINSEENKWTRVRICLPALVDVVNENELTGTSNSEISTGKKIFVVEDNHTVRRMITTFLVTAGHQVQAAHSAEHALEILEKTEIEFDLILTDVIMHGMTGKDLADRLKEIKPELPVLFMSGYSDAIMVKQGSNVSEIHFIEKPFKKTELLDKVDGILKG